MASENRCSATLDSSMDVDMSTGTYDMSMSTTDDYVHVGQPQVGGGRRAPSSLVVVMPTRTLRPRTLKATSKDTGLVRDAAVRRRQLPTPAPLPHSSGEANLVDDNPFLSEPVVQPNAGARQPSPFFPPSGSTNNNDDQQGMCYFSCSPQTYNLLEYRLSYSRCCACGQLITQ